MNRPRVVVAEDHALIQEAIRRVLLCQACDILAVVEDGPAALTTVAEQQPDFVLLDVSLPGLNGFAVARRVQASWPAVKIIFLTAQSERVMVEEAFRVGASGFVVKGAMLTELPAALQAIQAGETYRSRLVS